jgi:thioredoxin-like negative regulator of GroEL
MVSNPRLLGAPNIEQTSDVKVDAVSKAKPRPANFVVNVLGGARKFSYESLFIQGHELWLEREFAKAFKVFDLLSTVTDRGPRASIIKAHCAVMEQKFSDGSAILWQALPKEKYAKAAANLHDIFVLWKFKFYNEVRQELEQFVREFPDLPTPALLLGDFFSQAGQRKNAMKYLQLAQERDCEGGSVARIAIAKMDILRRRGVKEAPH